MTTLQDTIANAGSVLDTSSDSAILDAELLLAFVLGKSRTYLRTWPEHELTPLQSEHFKYLLQLRHEGQPVSYLIGYREFWSREFSVTPSVLIPRPETELLVESALNKIPVNQPQTVLDLGTGSGAIGITLAAERPEIKVTATDICNNALKVARSNAERLEVYNISFQQSDWFQDLKPKLYNLIVSNPPYIAPDDPHLQQGDVRFEPEVALISNAHGLADINLIVDTARQYLTVGGWIFFEHGYNQQQQVQSILQRAGYQAINTQKDLAGQPRVTSAQWCCATINKIF